MKKIKEFFGRLIANRALVLPLIVGICLLAVVNFGVLKKSAHTKPNNNLPVNIENVIIYPDRANPAMFTYDRVSGGCIITGIKKEVSVDKYAFIILPESTASGTVVGVADGAFKNSPIKGVIVPTTVKAVGEGAFENCTELKFVKFLSATEGAINTTVIYKAAFKNCTNLKDVRLGNTIGEVKDEAFGFSVERLVVESGKIYASIKANGAVGGAVDKNTVILTQATVAGHVVDDGSNDYLKYFYNLSECVLDGVTYLEYTLKGDIITLTLNLSGGEMADGVAGVIYRTTISFVKVEDNDGTIKLKVLDDNYNLVDLEDNTISLPVVRKLGYWFKEWRTDSGAVYSKIDQSLNEDITLNAIFLPRLIFIDFETNGGVNDERNLSGSTEKISYSTGGNQRELYPATKEYSIFCGWYLDADFKTPISAINDNIFNYITYFDEGKPESEIEKQKTITIYAKFETILTIDSGVVVGVNSLAKNLNEIVIPESVNGLNISAIGDDCFNTCYNLKSLSIKARISAIGNRAFKGCDSLEKLVYDGVGLVTIGDSAFENCTSLVDFTIKNSVKSIGKNAFKNCASLNKITIEEGLLITKIEDGTFENCWSLTTINLPNGVSWFGENAFKNCAMLNANTFDNIKFSVLKKNCFEGVLKLKKLTLGKTLQVVEAGVFKNCKGLESVEFESEFSYLTIEDDMFFGATSLQSVTLPSCVTKIGANAFYNCTALNTCALAEGLLEIGESAFCGSAITVVNIPNSCVKIGKNAFAGLNILTLNIGERVCGWWSGDNFLAIESVYDLVNVLKSGRAITYSAPYVLDESGFIESADSRLPKIIVANSVKGINAGAFDNCTNLTSLLFERESGWFAGTEELTIQNSSGNTEILERIKTTSIANEAVLVIENGVVTGCTASINKISLLVVPEGVTEIKSGSISTGENITKIILPSTLKKIEAGAISGLNNLQSIQFVDELYWYKNGESVLLGNPQISATILQTLDYDLVKKEMFNIFGKTLVGLTEEGKSANELRLPAFVEEIAKNALDGSLATKIIVGSKVKTFGDYAFAGAKNVKNIIFESGSAPLSFGEGCFNGLEYLEEIALPEGVTTVGANLFEGCKSLKSVDLGNIETISANMFKGCSALTTITGLENVKVIGDRAFMFCVKLESFICPTNLSCIGLFAFYNCIKLESVQFNEGLTIIGESAFSGCESLGETVTLTDSVREVGGNCFSNCFSLKTLVFGSGIEKIGAYLVFNNNGIASVTNIVLADGLCFGLYEIESNEPIISGIVIGTKDFTSGSGLAYYFNKQYKHLVWIKN